MLRKEYINLENKGLTKLPNNIPKIVKGDFDCRSNKLKTLENGPIQTKYSYICSFNNLINLDYGPKNVGLNFICHENKNLKLIEILKFLLKSKVEGSIISDYDDNFINQFNESKDNYEKIKLIFRMR